MQDQVLQRSFAMERLTAVAASPDGALLAAGGVSGVFVGCAQHARDGGLTYLMILTSAGHEQSYLSLSQSHKGKRQRKGMKPAIPTFLDPCLCGQSHAAPGPPGRRLCLKC